MGVDNLDFGALNESGTLQEITEEERKKVAEDGKKAQQAHQQTKKNQEENAKFALFLSQVLKRYYSNNKIITFLYDLLHNLENNEEKIFIIFSPFILGNGFESISSYIDYLKKYSLNGIDKNYIFEIIEFEKLGGKKLWSNLKNGKTEISYEDFKIQILDSLEN